jgi:uncharacterized protein YdbL (DUF1318 family)
MVLAMGVVAGASRDSSQESDESGAPHGVILDIVDSRARRLPEIERYKSAGIIGENNRGDLEILKPYHDPTKLERLELVVEGENADRERLYVALAAGSGGGPDALVEVRESYAELLRESARRGEWIQLPDGKWKKKNGE